MVTWECRRNSRGLTDRDRSDALHPRHTRHRSASTPARRARTASPPAAAPSVVEPVETRSPSTEASRTGPRTRWSSPSRPGHHPQSRRTQQGERSRRMAEDPERLGPPGTDRVGVALLEQDLGDPVHHRDQVDDLAGGGLRDERLQAVLVGLPGDHEPLQLRRQPPRLGGLGVGGDDPGFEQLHEASPGQRRQVRRGRLVDLAGPGPGSVRWRGSGRRRAAPATPARGRP